MGLVAGFIDLFIRHRNAANLLMALMLLLGVYGISELNRQVMPTFGFDVITISVPWPGASPEDIESSILEAIEPKIRFLDGVKRTQSTATEGSASITLTYTEGYNKSKALTDVQIALAGITTLPSEIEKPIITAVATKDSVITLEISGPFSEQALKAIAQNMRDDLMDRGLERIELSGVRSTEYWVEISNFVLREVGLSVQEISDRIAQSSVDLPSGSIDSDNFSQQIRSTGLARSPRDLGDIEVKSQDTGAKVRLKDIASILETFKEGGVSHQVGDNPSITIRIARAVDEDTMLLHERVKSYLEEVGPSLPPTLEIQQYDVYATLVGQRLGMLVYNGLGGLILVIGVLYIFLSGRLAFWVAAGIPVSLMATLGIMSFLGLSLNMVSMFAMIMGLGIIVDDAIVVGEQVAKLHAKGKTALEAVTEGTKMMFAPVMAASLTTVATFFPILMLNGALGQIQAEMPKTMIAILIASLIECFFILPAHLLHSLEHVNKSKPRPWRVRFNNKFDQIRQNALRPFVEFCFRERYSVLLTAVGGLIIAITILGTGRVGFEFFPQVESNTIYANFAFNPGSARYKSSAMLEELERSLYATDEEIRGKNLDQKSNVSVVVRVIGAPQGRSVSLKSKGDHLGSLAIELIDSEQRNTRTQAFIDSWMEHINEQPGLERLTIVERKEGGPQGRAVDIRLFNADLKTLKLAARALQEELSTIPGVFALEDNLPYGKQEIALELTPEGKSMGFTTQMVARQVRNAYEGSIAKRFTLNQEEILIRVKLPERNKDSVALRNLTMMAEGSTRGVPLSEVVNFKKTTGFSQILREDGVRQVSVLGDVDADIITNNEVVQLFNDEIKPKIEAQFPGVEFGLKGKADEQNEAFTDIKMGALVAFSSAYIILAWVLASYSRPLVVMSIIPFGIVGAVVGHWVFGFNMSMVSIIGILGLSGIVVNDAIILVSTIKIKEEEGMDLHQAVVDSASERLRPVLLTTFTTIGGLIPILTETSRQAMVVQPLAITIVFGLLFATVIVLGFVPALLGIIDDITGKSKAAKTADKTDNFINEPLSSP
jgi:multidrug efflux pump subunit AcrB